MKHSVQLIVYSGKDTTPFRKEWILPNVTPEEFDVKKHTGSVFMYPEGKELTAESMYVWKYCTPENNEEERQLIEMGKIAAPLRVGTYGEKNERQ